MNWIGVMSVNNTNGIMRMQRLSRVVHSTLQTRISFVIGDKYTNVNDLSLIKFAIENDGRQLGTYLLTVSFFKFALLRFRHAKL